jgi:hypothetical protein
VVTRGTVPDAAAEASGTTNATILKRLPAGICSYSRWLMHG